MSPVVVRRALVLFTAGLLAVAAVFAVVVSRRRPAPATTPAAAVTTDAAGFFEARCGSCHELSDVAAFVRAAPDLEAGRRAFEREADR